MSHSTPNTPLEKDGPSFEALRYTSISRTYTDDHVFYHIERAWTGHERPRLNHESMLQNEKRGLVRAMTLFINGKGDSPVPVIVAKTGQSSNCHADTQIFQADLTLFAYNGPLCQFVDEIATALNTSSSSSIL